MDFGVLRLGVIAGTAIATTTFAFGIASAPSRKAERLGHRGLKRQRAAGEGMFASIEPLVRWLGARLDGLLPEPTYKKLDRQLVLSGDYLGLTPDEYVATTILSFLAACGMSAFYLSSNGAPVAAMIMVVFGVLVPYIMVSGEVDRRARDIARGLPYVIDLLALSMSAGLDFPGAVRQVVGRSTNRDDALNEELERILQELALGHTRREALENFADRTAVTAVTEFVASVVQSEQRGNPLAETLVVQAQVSRQQRSMRAETMAAKKATQVYIPLGLALVSVLLLVGGPLILKMQDFMESQ